jgi:hypothetical protein
VLTHVGCAPPRLKGVGLATEVYAAAFGATAALLGAVVGGGANLLVEHKRARQARRDLLRNDLLKTCSEFTGAVTRVRSLSHRVKTNPGVDDAISDALDQARVECERLRLLLRSTDTQMAARLALRHVYAVWKYEKDGVDPRANDYPGQGPYQRLRAALTKLYVGVREETGAEAPQDVFEELD